MAGAHGSGIPSRVGADRRVTSAGPTSSSHDSGVAIGAPGRARSEYGTMEVAGTALRSQSRNIRPRRSAFLNDIVNVAGAARAISSAAPRAACAITALSGPPEMKATRW